jgi:hypothetical protein
MVKSSLGGTYHDFLMWSLFFGLILFYTIKPKIKFKVIFFSFSIFALFFIQSLKQIYRNEVWFGYKESNISTVISSSKSASNIDNLTSESNYLATLNRLNQAWIFASTVDNMNTFNNFQGINHFYQYFESALLPRFLFPDKLESGSNLIFNKYSGHVINAGTSMGLGVFADGYVAYGKWGLWITSFLFGLIFVGIFYVIEYWILISPYFLFFLFPILIYAVRPDCELQTILGHIFKSLFLYGLLVFSLKKYFRLKFELINQ